MNKIKRLTSFHIEYILLIIAAAALLIRAQYSFCYSDETFYFSTAHRFLQGDAIMVHDWFPTQLVSLILMPFLWIYEGIAGGTTGVILFFRIIYVFFSAFTAFCSYRILKIKKGRISALLSMLFIMFYCHLNIATMSYYTLSACCFLLFLLLIYLYAVKFISKPATDNEVRKDANTKSISLKSHPKELTLVLSGLFLALAVLSLPTLVIPYILLSAAVIVLSIKYKYLRSMYLWNLIGIAIPASIVTLYLLVNSGLSRIINTIPLILSDEEHATSLVYPFKNFFISVYDVFGKRFVYISFALIIAAAILRFAKNRLSKIGSSYACRIYPLLFIAILCTDIGLFTIYAGRCFSNTGFIATALILFAAPLVFLTQKADFRLFFITYAGGLIFSMTYSYSSLCDLYVLSIGHNIAAVGALCCIGDFIKENIRRVNTRNRFADSTFRILILACCAIAAYSVFITITLRFTSVYRDAPIKRLDTRLTEGPAAGLITTRTHADTYSNIYADIKANEINGEPVFFTKLLPWGYLCCDMKCASPTTWRTPISSDRLKLYYEAYPDRFPKVIFMMKESVGSYEKSGTIEGDPAPNTNEFTGCLPEIIKSKSYESIETREMIIYRVP